jgi:hypothetical protein
MKKRCGERMWWVLLPFVLSFLLVAEVTILISYFILLILPPAGVGNTKLVDFVI